MITPEKQEIEKSGREKFEKLSDSVKVQFKNLYEHDDIGSIQILLIRNGFTLDEAARFTMFIIDLHE